MSPSPVRWGAGPAVLAREAERCTNMAMVRVSRMQSGWHQARLVLRHGGTLALLGLLARKLLRPVLSWKTLCFFERDLSAPEPEVRARIPVEARVATRQDLERFREILLQGGVPWSQVEALLSRGDICFLGMAEDRLVHFMWLALHSVWDPAVGATVVLGPEEAYVSSSHTDPGARGNRVQPAVASFMIRYAQSRHRKRLFYHVERQNYSGLKIVAAARAAGKTRPRHTVRFFRFVGFKHLLAIGPHPLRIPRLELPEDASVWRLGRFGMWVSGRSARPSSS